MSRTPSVASRNASGTARPTVPAVACGLMLAAMEGAIRASDSPMASQTDSSRRRVAGCSAWCATASMLPLEHRESHSPNDLVAHLGAARVLGPAGGEHAASEQVAEPRHEDRVGLQRVERGRLIGGEGPDAAPAGRLSVEVGRVVRGGLGQGELAVQAVEAREDEAAEREVRVAARVA